MELSQNILRKVIYVFLDVVTVVLSTYFPLAHDFSNV